MGACKQEVALLFLPWQSLGLQNLVFQKAQLAHKEIADLSLSPRVLPGMGMNCLGNQYLQSYLGVDCLWVFRYW